jgi:hypothetical protein
MKVWVAFLIGIFILAARPGARRPGPRNAVLGAACVLVSVLLYSYRYV